MREQPCTRCQNPVLLDEGHLVYCSHCGAPQIFLAEDLQREMEDRAQGYFEQTAAEAVAQEDSTGSQRKPADRFSMLRPRPGETAWMLAVRCALLSGAVALALGLLSLLLPAAGILLFMWLLSAPMLTVIFYYQRAAAATAAPGDVSARLGLLTGGLLVCACAVIFVVSLVLTRFVFHDAAALDAQLAANVAQQRTVLTARLGADVQPTLNMLAIPEYRVGLLIGVVFSGAMFYLALSTLSAGVTGLLVRRRQ